MHLILLSGGSGKRLWPLSNEVRSKQFLKLLPHEDKTESMVQRVYRQIRTAGISAPIVVTTSKNQEDSLRAQLVGDMEVVLEPSRRDTFPAIALSSCYLAKEKGCSPDEVVVVLPVDPFTELGYFETILHMAKTVESGQVDLALMGITPTYPSEKYGYIVAETKETLLWVSRFQEKPDLPTAEALLEQGAFWNGGVFAFQLSYLMNILGKYGDYASYQDLYQRYDSLPKISFDYEVVEKAKSIAVLPFQGMWKDLGTWNTLSEELCDHQEGVIRGEGSKNTQIINELSIPIVALGCENMVIAASPDGILISTKEKSSYMKPYVEQLQGRPMYEERRWGSYRVLDYQSFEGGRKSLVKELYVKENHHISYQKHEHRREIWTLSSGCGKFCLDGVETLVQEGDVLQIEAGQKHSMFATTPCTIIEVQMGKEVSEDDIQRYPSPWDKTEK